MPSSDTDRRVFDRLLRDLNGRGKDVHGDAGMRLLTQVLADGLAQATLRGTGAVPRGAAILSAAGRFDENGAEVVDVGEGGAGDQQIAGGGEDGP